MTIQNLIFDNDRKTIWTASLSFHSIGMFWDYFSILYTIELWKKWCVYQKSERPIYSDQKRRLIYYSSKHKYSWLAVKRAMYSTADLFKGCCNFCITFEKHEKQLTPFRSVDHETVKTGAECRKKSFSLNDNNFHLYYRFAFKCDICFLQGIKHWKKHLLIF